MEQNESQLRTQNKKTKLDLVIKNIVGQLRKAHITYAETKRIFKTVRKELELNPPKDSKGVKEHLSKKEMENMIDYAYSCKSKYGLLIKTLLFTGCRVSEFVNIKIQNVYLDEAKIYIEKAKGDKPRYVPIFNFLLHELRTYIGDRKEGYLFESRYHNKFSTRRIQQIVKEVAEKVEIQKRVHPHMLRRTIATWLRDRRMPIESIKLFLGHQKFETTEIYAKGSIKQLTDDMNQALLEHKE